MGSLIAGGSVARTYDDAGQYLGLTVTTYDGDSEIRVLRRPADSLRPRCPRRTTDRSAGRRRSRRSRRAIFR
ncbi:MAG UNVERIFIED_CONTAM: hypothetical protein LVR18_14310 [Planctomycetaceae bacterium]